MEAAWTSDTLVTYHNTLHGVTTLTTTTWKITNEYYAEPCFHFLP